MAITLTLTLLAAVLTAVSAGPTQYGQTQYGQTQYGQTQYGQTQYGPPQYGPDMGCGYGTWAMMRSQWTYADFWGGRVRSNPYWQYGEVFFTATAFWWKGSVSGTTSIIRSIREYAASNPSDVGGLNTAWIQQAIGLDLNFGWGSGGWRFYGQFTFLYMGSKDYGYHYVHCPGYSVVASKDCEGTWSECSVYCTRTFTTLVFQSGNGDPCPAAPACSPGEGSCPADEESDEASVEASGEASDEASGEASDEASNEASDEESPSPSPSPTPTPSPSPSPSWEFESNDCGLQTGDGNHYTRYYGVSVSECQTLCMETDECALQSPPRIYFSDDGTFCDVYTTSVSVEGGCQGSIYQYTVTSASPSPTPTPTPTSASTCTNDDQFAALVGDQFGIPITDCEHAVDLAAAIHYGCDDDLADLFENVTEPEYLSDYCCETCSSVDSSLVDECLDHDDLAVSIAALFGQDITGCTEAVAGMIAFGVACDTDLAFMGLYGTNNDYCCATCSAITTSGSDDTGSDDTDSVDTGSTDDARDDSSASFDGASVFGIIVGVIGAMLF